MVDQLIAFFDSGTHLVQIGGFAVAFFGALAETIVGLSAIVPGSSMLFVLGALAQQGYMPLVPVILLAIAGAVVGDNIAYLLGWRYGRKWIKQGTRFLDPSHMKRAENFFRRHGCISVFLGRFIPILKETVPLIAGMTRMSQHSFILWNFFGACGWAFLWIGSGALLAHSLVHAELLVRHAGLLVLGIIVAIGILLGLYNLVIWYGRRVANVMRSIVRSAWRGITQDEHVQHFAHKYARLLKFISARFDKTHFWGRPFTFVMLAGLYVAALIAGVVESVVTSSDSIVYVDKRVVALMHILQYDSLTTFFIVLTTFGNKIFVAVSTITLAVILTLWRKERYAIGLVTSVGVAAFITWIGKIFFARPRPELALLVENSFSFPSGHATNAVAFYGFMLFLLISVIRYWRRRIAVLFVGIFFITLLGLSRVYLNVHYVSDIWGGFLVGTLGLLIGISITVWFRYRAKTFVSLPAVLYKWRRTITMVMVCISVSVYAVLVSQPHVIRDVSHVRTTQTVAVSDFDKIFSTEQLHYTETLTGVRQEPFSFLITAKSDDDFVEAFARAEWVLADDITLRSLSRMLFAALLKERYPTAPMTPSFWNMRVHDFGFQRESEEGGGANKRHHARFWRTDFRTKDGSIIYIGTASYDKGVKWGGITHVIDPAIDVERDTLKDDLVRSGVATVRALNQFVRPLIGKNFAGDTFFTDGKIYIMNITTPTHE